MEILLISAGPLSKGTMASKVPLFFPARPYLMKKVTSDFLVKADLVVIELAGADGDSLNVLKAALAEVPEQRVLCLISKFSRREIVQAKVLGNVRLFDRDGDWEVLVREIRGLLSDKTKVEFGDDTPAELQASFKSAASAMDQMSQAAISGAPLPVKAMEKTAGAICDTLSKYGLAKWLDTVQLHHSHTYSHSMMVAGVASAFASGLGWTSKECEQITVAGLVHDIGKTKIPLAILDKPGRLTDEEMAIIRKHPVFSRKLLENRTEISAAIKEMAAHHHEFLDGSGYPDGLSGDQISPIVRLMTISDIYSALTEKRSYKEAFTPRAAYAELVAMGGKLDQKFVRSFRSIVVNSGFCTVNRTADTGKVKVAAG